MAFCRNLCRPLAILTAGSGKGGMMDWEWDGIFLAPQNAQFGASVEIAHKAVDACMQDTLW